MVLLHIITLVITNFRPFHSSSYRFQGYNFFRENGKIGQFGQSWPHYTNFQKTVLLHIITLVIPNIRPFRSSSYRFQDNNFFRENGKIGQIWPHYKIFKYWQFFSKLRTHDLEVLSHNYEKALLSIGNIAAKFE